MEKMELTYGEEGFNEIKDFLKKNTYDDYTLSIYDIMSQATMEIQCSIEEMLNIIMFVSEKEHDFPEWIGVNELSDSYVVGMNFTRGFFQVPSIYVAKDGKLEKKL